MFGKAGPADGPPAKRISGNTRFFAFFCGSRKSDPIQKAKIMSHDVPPEFARLLVSAFQDAGETRPIHYDPDTFKLFLDGEDRAFWIGNLFFELLRTDPKHLSTFLSAAWKIWCLVQDELPNLPRWIPEILRPFRDETHPLSYRVEPIPDTPYWAVAPPFDESAGCEGFEFPDVYETWWSNQIQRACKTNLRNMSHWLESGQVTVEGLSILSDLRRLFQQGRLKSNTYKYPLVAEELRSIGCGPSLPPNLRLFLQVASDEFGSLQSAASAYRNQRQRN